MVWYGMVWYGMVWYGMVWYGMVWYDKAYHTFFSLTKEQIAKCSMLISKISRTVVWDNITQVTFDSLERQLQKIGPLKRKKLQLP
jgi:hypothetical protein